VTISSTEKSPPAWRQRAARALRNPLYRRYFMAQIPLVVASWIHSIALGWLMWRLSASPWLLGLLALCDLGPTFLLAPITGTVSDRMDRRWLLTITQGSFILLVSALAVLTLSGLVTIEIVLVLTLALGIVTSFDSPSRQALVGDMVGHDDLRNAIALNSMLFNAARLVGPAIGGAIVATVGEGWCFVLKALAYMPMLYTLLTFKGVLPARHERRSFFLDMRQGFVFVRSHPEAGRILILVGICSFTSVPYFSFRPALASEMLKSDAGVAGMLMSITGVGAVMAAATLTLRDGLDTMRFWPVWSAFLLGLVQCGIGLSAYIPLTAALALPMGFAILSQNLASNTLLQQFAPPAFRGRVMAMYSMMMLGTVPLGSLVVGALGDWLGMPVTFVAGGLLCSAVALVIGLLPKRRSIEAAASGLPLSPEQ
jgi:MFS family permease